MPADNHPSRFTLERLLAQDLSPADADRVRSHTATCQVCSAIESQLRADAESFHAEVPYAAFRIEHEQRRGARTNRMRLWWWVPRLVTTAAVAGLLLVTLARDPAIEDSSVRIKGSGVALAFAVQTPAGLRPGIAGQRLEAKSTVQLSYDAGEFSYLAVVGWDMSGQVTTYFPEAGDTLVPLPAGSTGALPFSLVLDDLPGQEHFVAVFAHEPLALAPVLQAARRATQNTQGQKSLLLPAGMGQAAVWIDKQ